ALVGQRREGLPDGGPFERELADDGGEWQRIEPNHVRVRIRLQVEREALRGGAAAAIDRTPDLGEEVRVDDAWPISAHRRRPWAVGPTIAGSRGVSRAACGRRATARPA